MQVTRAARWTAVFVAMGALGGCGNPSIVSGHGGTGGTAGAEGGRGGGSGAGVPDAGFTFNLDALGNLDAPAGTGGTTGGDDNPTCASSVNKAEMVPLDLLFLVDTSGSMNESTGSQSKWQLLRPAVSSFWKDPRSAGLNAALQFFPLKGGDRVCTANGGECGPNGPCHTRMICAGSKLTLPATGCDPAQGLDCPTGSTCVAAGFCSLSGGDCVKPGMPCPTGAPGDMCTARGMICAGIGTGSCTAADYQTMTVPFVTLNAGESMLTSAVTIKEPIGFTPTGAAVTGSLTYLRSYLAAHAGHKGALVLFTDGTPFGCTDNDVTAIATTIAAAQKEGIPTYVIGVFAASAGSGPDAIAQWATAGGTAPATVLTPTADFGQKLLTALNAIRGAALPCEFAIPPPTSGMKLDLGKVNVRYTTGNDATELGYVGSAGKCDAAMGGWYYDMDPKTGNASRVLLCPTTCSQVKQDATAKIDLVFGCATRIIQ